MSYPASDPFVIRPATAGDRTFVLGLIPRLAHSVRPPYGQRRRFDEGERRTLNRYFDAPLDGTALWVAEDARGTRLGAAYAEQAIDYFTQEPHGHIGILAVSEAAEGRGVGQALIAAVENWAAAQGFRFMTLNVFAANKRASAVYERAGYRPDTVRYVREL